jgi:hypothetical protein
MGTVRQISLPPVETTGLVRLLRRKRKQPAQLRDPG